MIICLILFFNGSWCSVKGSEYYQSPQLNKPRVGSVAGWLSGFNPKQIGMGQGEVQIALPISLPSDRGSIGINIFPTYQISNGMSEWGQGWSRGLTISRFREVGLPQYNDEDHFSSPWGILRKGNDGYYYGKSADGMVRGLIASDEFIIYTPDGKTYTFNHLDSTESDLGVYSWHLSYISDKEDRHTKIVWLNNDSARPFISEVYYGGKGESFQYRVDFFYKKSLEPPYVDYRTGKRRELDQFVDKVLVNTLQQGEFKLKWSYQFDIQREEHSYSFYMKSMIKSYSSGASEPPVTFSYDLGERFWLNPKLEKVSGYEGFWSEGGNFLMAFDTMIPLDINLDGLMDFSDVKNRYMYVRSKLGFTSEPMGEFQLDDLDADDKCRDSGRNRLIYSRIKGFHDDLSVVKFLSDGSGSHIYICDLQGVLKHKESFPVRSRIGNRGGFVDINNDGKDEVVIVSTNIKIFQNQSTADTFKFDYVATALDRPEGRKFNHADSIHFHDMNGDGLLDIVGQSINGLNVLYGRGNYQFDSKSFFLPFLNQLGRSSFKNTGYLSHFGDLNKDGLTDLIFYSETAFYTMINNGESLHHVPLFIEGIRNHAPIKPVLIDFEGSGNQQIGIISNVSGLLKIDLNSPSTGLLRSYSDGKGNRISFTYERGPSEEGMGLGKVITKTISKKSKGHKEQVWVVTLESPQVHPSRPSIIGYQSIQQVSGPVETKYQKIYSVFDAPRKTSIEWKDRRVTGWKKRISNAFEPFEVAGIEFYRPQSSLGEWLLDGERIGPLNEITFDLYDQGMCLKQSTVTNQHGKKIDLKTFWVNADWDLHLHCKPEEVSVEGIHSNESYNFVTKDKIKYNDRGQVTHVYQDENNRWLLQNKITYDPLTYLPESMFDASKGVFSFDFDDETYLLESILHPDRHRENLTRDSADQIMSYSIFRGSENSFKTSFLWNSREMLASIWDSLSNSSQTSPLQMYLYSFASEESLGTIETQSMNTIGGYLKKSQIISANNTNLADILQLDSDSYWMNNILNQDLVVNSEQYFAPRQVEGIWEVNQFLEEAYTSTVVSRVEDSIFFPELSKAKLWQKDVNESMRRKLTSERGNRILTSTTNDSFATHKTIGFHNEVLEFADQMGSLWSYTYDVLGRLRRVQKPDQHYIEIELDDLGRVRKTSSEMVGSIVYGYIEGKDLIDRKVYQNVNGGLEREVVFSYDKVGRIQSKRLTKGKESKVLRYIYDGSETNFRDQNGFLTKVVDENFNKTWKYRIDGKVESLTIDLLKEKIQLQLHYNYFDNQLLKSIDLIASSPNQTVSYSQDFFYDELNRLEKIGVDGIEVVSLVYNKHNNVSQIIFSTDEKSIFPLYDEITSKNSGYKGKEAKYSFSYNDRGLIKAESFNNLFRDYYYDSRGFLDSYIGINTLSYDYTDSGIANFFGDNLRGLPRITNNGSSIGVIFDGLGRVTTLGSSRFKYGVDGNLAHAENNKGTARYIYDELDQRLASIYKDKILFKYDDFSVIFEKGDLKVSSPIKVAGYTVGIIQNGRFELQYSDQRGTIFGAGESAWSSPYGVRNTLQTNSEIIDYADHGRDSVTGLIRFGQRDYSPELGKFISPDPLFLERPELCVNSPVECNLYSYAKNNPLKYIDPTGNAAETIWDVASIAAGVYSISQWHDQTSLGSKVADVGGLVVDSLAVVVPFLPGGVGLGLKATRGADKVADSAQGINKFPSNPNNLTKQLGVQPKISKTPDGAVRMKWQPNQNTRIRYESHPHGLRPGDIGFNPRHHGNHYHVETKPYGMSWNKAGKTGNIHKSKPEGYIPGNGTGFTPGEKFPGAN